MYSSKDYNLEFNIGLGEHTSQVDLGNTQAKGMDYLVENKDQTIPIV